MNVCKRFLVLYSLIIIFIQCSTPDYHVNGKDWEIEVIKSISADNSAKTCRILGYRGESFNGIFPSTIDDMRVEEIVGGQEEKQNIFKTKLDSSLTILDFSQAKYLKLIGKEAFYGCRQVKKIILNKNLERIGEGAFADCRNVEEIHWGEAIRKIGDGAFYNNNHLREIRLPEALDSLAPFAFYACDSLRKVICNDKLSYIGERTFANCFAMKDLSLSKSLKFIGKRAFLNCAGISSVTLHEKIEVVDNEAFSRCSKLSSVKIKASNTSIEAKTFASTPLSTSTNAQLLYPKTADYIDQIYWKDLMCRMIAE